MKTSKDMQRNERLRQTRIERNWRQHELAEHLGTTTVTIKRWERGSQQPSLYFRAKLCALFGKSAEELGLREGEPSVSIAEEAVLDSGAADLSCTEAGALWMVPSMRNPHFTGRADLLEQLDQALSVKQAGDAPTTRRAVLSQPQAIKGLGGIGKTQLAVEYAYRAREQDRYTHTFWINAASEEAILASFQTLAGQLPDGVVKDEPDQRKLVAAVLRWLEQCAQPWLLIVDNADDLALVQPFLPQQGQGSLLLTTRASAVGWLASPLEVEPMGLLEGTQLLLHRTHRLAASDEESNEASNVVMALDGFPLALDQAGAYIEETGCSFGDYLQLYEQHRARLLARRGGQATNYPHSVATTWALSFEKIEQAHPAAAELLRLCAYLSPDHIPEELLINGANYWPAVLQEAVTDPLSFNEMLEALLAFSLVKRLAHERLLSLHRLVQAVQMDRMEAEEQRTWAERVVCAVHTLFPVDPRNEIETWPLCLRYLEQVQVCDWLIHQYGLQLPEAAELLERAAIYLRELSSYDLAEPLFQRALAIAEQQMGPEHLQVASSLSNLGILYLQQDKYERAEPLYQRALQIREQALGPQHPQVARSLNNLGILYWWQGKYEPAESLLRRALHIWERALGPEHPQVASPLTNLGGLYIEQGKYEPAEPLLQRAVHIWEQALGLEHPQVAFPLTDLGNLYRLQGRYELAERVLQRSVRIREQALGPQHTVLFASLNALANLARDQGQYEQAEALYQRALSLRQQSHGAEHSDVAETMHELARLRQMQQRDAEALSLYQQALAIREQLLGANHLMTCETRERLRAVLQTVSSTAADLEAPPGPAK